MTRGEFELGEKNEKKFREEASTLLSSSNSPLCLDLSGENYICTKKTTLKHFINENANHISAREAGLIISANMRIQLLLLEGDLLEFSCCSVFRFETLV